MLTSCRILSDIADAFNARLATMALPHQDSSIGMAPKRGTPTSEISERAAAALAHGVFARAK